LKLLAEAEAAASRVVSRESYASTSNRYLRWTFRLAEFGAIQGIVQLLTALSGLLIVRSLAKQDYALFAIVNSMQTTGNLLADLGIGIGLRSIGGKVWDDPDRFGQLLNTALRLRRQLATISLSVTVPLAAWMLWRNGASLPLLVGLCICIIAGVIPLLGAAVFTTSLQLHAQYRRMQNIDFGSGLLRLALIAGLAVTHINALLAATVGVVGNWVQFVFTRRWAHEHTNIAASANIEYERELRRLSWRWMPNVLFYCFQGQVTLLILTFVGNTTGIADITALGRIATLFAIFSAAFNSVLAPRFARCQDPVRLPRLYLLLVGGSMTAFALLLLVAWLFPAPLLWLVGSKYTGLQNECVWVVAAGCVTLLGSVIFGLNAAKAWIRIQSVAYIPAVITAQLIAAACLDLREFQNVLIFGLVTAVVPIPCFVIDSVIGMRKVRAGFQSKAQPSCKFIGD